jgi:[FeFe] hydrogenase H-cluster maturation GTPase HydF
MVSANRGERLHIGIFGKRNAGKSSLINAITSQDIALVSKTPGTTTDPVYKAMEILPIGPVVLIDTAGLDDTGELGEKRVSKTRQVLNKCDFALIVAEYNNFTENNFDYEKELIALIKEKDIPLVLVINKIDLVNSVSFSDESITKELGIPTVLVSATNNLGIEELKHLIIKNSRMDWREPTIIGDILNPGELAVLVVPIDNAAPKGRLILPQVQTIRDILDNDSLAVVVKERELAHSLKILHQKPKIVITDSQAFQQVAADTPEDILMTSFSILFAKYKGDLEAYLRGIKKIKQLKDGDKILIAEACTHHVQSDDIGTIKIPKWLRQLTGKELHFEKSSGIGFPENIKDFSLIVHCGGCMLNRREILYRIGVSESEQIPITNYGMIIAYSFGILERALKPFPLAKSLFENE